MGCARQAANELAGLARLLPDGAKGHGQPLVRPGLGRHYLSNKTALAMVIKLVEAAQSVLAPRWHNQLIQKTRPPPAQILEARRVRRRPRRKALKLLTARM
jgi:hypothetical protein